jgi:hypothetical protein
MYFKRSLIQLNILTVMEIQIDLETTCWRVIFALTRTEQVVFW